MDYSFEMEVFQTIENLACEGFGDVFVESPAFMKAAANAASRYILQETEIPLRNVHIAETLKLLTCSRTLETPRTPGTGRYGDGPSP